MIGAPPIVVFGGESRVPSSIAELGRLCEAQGITQVWVHESAFPRFDPPWPKEAVHELRGIPFLEAGPFANGRESSLRPWSYWYRKGGAGFDLHVPAWSRSPFRECATPEELLREVSRFHVATKGVPWKGTGAITSDAFLRRSLRGKVEPTLLPDGYQRARELPMVTHRTPAVAEVAGARGRYCYGFDLNLAYANGASSLELPVGDPELIGSTLYLGQRWPAIYMLGEAMVTAPTMERMPPGTRAEGAWIWHNHGRYLRGWYETIRDARGALLGDGGPALEAVKDMAREGLGRLASRSRTTRGHADPETDALYQPLWAWSVIAEVRERLLYRVRYITKRDPVAIDTDAIYYLSSRQSHEAVAEELGISLGEGLGQFKAAGRCAGKAATIALSPTVRSATAVSSLRELVQ